jgi:hypothetical protein
MKHILRPFALFLFLGASMTVAAWLPPADSRPVPQESSELAYHNHPPTEPLPDTLDPAEFRNNRAAFVVYSLAAEIKATLYQLPCYCSCKRMHGHQSLLDCYASKHGVACPTCQKELLYCYHRLSKERASPNSIRADLAKGKAWSISIEKETERFFRKWETQAK